MMSSRSSTSSSSVLLQPRSHRSCSYFSTSSGHHRDSDGSDNNGLDPKDDDSSSKQSSPQEKVYWNDEWKRLGLGATFVTDDDDDDGGAKEDDRQRRSQNHRKQRLPDNLFFVQLGFGVDQHGDTTNDATKAAVRAVRNAIEFNSIPGVIQHIPGGRHEMLIHVKLGVPSSRRQRDNNNNNNEDIDDDETNSTTMIPSYVDKAQVAKVFPYGRLLPIEVVVGGINFHSGRVVEELGDKDDVGICCVACVTIGYDNGKDANANVDDGSPSHQTFNTKDGY